MYGMNQYLLYYIILYIYISCSVTFPLSFPLSVCPSVFVCIHLSLLPLYLSKKLPKVVQLISPINAVKRICLLISPLIDTSQMVCDAGVALSSPL